MDLETYQNEPIAIVGMSCKLPQCENVAKFWSILENGIDATSAPPEYRWLQEDYPKPIPQGCRSINAGFIHEKVDEFDSSFFGISPKEAVFMDPQQRLLHELVWEGLEDALIDPYSLKGTNGSVFIGSWTNDYKDILLECGYTDFYRRYIGNSIGAAAAKISFLLGLTGPSIATESGCSSAMVAVHMACKSLRSGETSIALCGGVNLLLKPFDKEDLPVMLSPEGRCKPFDSKADGFARAEGGGILVLKRLSDAVGDGDRIWAIIRGSGLSQEGLSKSMGTPTVHSESLAMELALKDANVEPEEVSFVEAHGTGTVVGDPMEMKAISKAYHSGNNRNQPLLIGSVKGNVGHTESSSGITGIIKVVLAMKHGIIPRQVNFDELNPLIDLDIIPAKIPVSNVKWERCEKKRRIAGVSSFGITGTDAHVIVEEPPLTNFKIVPSEKKRPVHLVKISAKTEEALDNLFERYREYLGKSQESLANIAFSANTGRANFKFRAALIASSKDKLLAKLEKGDMLKGEDHSTSKQICFLFTGQGSQYSGMAKELYNTSSVFQQSFDFCSNLLQERYKIDLKQAIWGTQSAKDINETIYSQTGIFCVEYALLKLWESLGVKPDFVLGHSLGEFAAAVCAGILNLEDALMLVTERSLLIGQLPTGKMLVVRGSSRDVQDLLKTFEENNLSLETLDYAAFNSVEQTVVAGDSDTIMKFSQFCSANGMKNMVLQASHAFHSRHMDPILEQYRNVAERVSRMMEGSDCQFISGVRGEILRADEIDAQYWVDHARQPVSFLKASHVAVEQGCGIFIEIGSQPVLSALTMLNNDSVNLTCLASLKRNEGEWDTLLHSVGKLWVNGFKIVWKGLHETPSGKKMSLPHYPFQGKRYWPDVVSIGGGEVVHPLLGYLMPNASPIKIFQSGINLKSLEYIQDHKINQDVIFPGAGYLEMCLAGGVQSIESTPSRPMAVMDLLIEAPLLIHEGTTCPMQTLVDLKSGNDINVKIYHRQDVGSNLKWVKHCEATFMAVPQAEDQRVGDTLDLTFVKNNIGDADKIQEVYHLLAIAGLKFGPSFLNAERFWSDKGKLIFKMNFGFGCTNKEKQYIVHPVQLDAMVQAIMFSRFTQENSASFLRLKKRKIFVPVKIGKFVWLPNSKPNEEEDHYYVQVSGEEGCETAIMSDSKGNVICKMSSVELVDTSSKAIESILKQQTNPMPDLWDEVWKVKLGSMQHRLDLGMTVKENFYSEQLLQETLSRSENPPEETLLIFDLMKQFSFLNMVKALRECGWRAELHTNFEFDSTMKQLGIRVEFGNYFRFMLRALEEEGMLQKLEKDHWQVLSEIPDMEEIKRKLMSSEFTQVLVHGFRSSVLLTQIGNNLQGILQGKTSPLRILFPATEDEANSVSTTDYYEDTVRVWGMTEMVHNVLMERIPHFKKCMKNNERFILRILEVGAGTGGVTEIILGILEDHFGMEYEYTYSDISLSFFPQAERRFEKSKKNMRFMKFNIEEDPLAQGLLPEYFDYICAFNVLHATRNIGESLENLKMVLRPQGKLDLLENTKVNRHITYCWGLLPGYWRFQDEFRKEHCTLPVETWKECLKSSGFNVEQYFPVLLGDHTLICSYRECGSESCHNNSDKTWVIIDTDMSPMSRFLLSKLKSVGRRVVFLLNSNSNGLQLPVSASIHKTNLNSEEELKVNLAKISRESGGNLEGIVYCLALDQRRKSQELFLKPLFHLCKILPGIGEQQRKPPKIVCFTMGNAPVPDGNGDMNIEHFETSTILGFCKSLRNEMIDLNCQCIDLDANISFENTAEMEQVFQELFTQTKEFQVAFRGLNRSIPKISFWKPPPQQDLSLPMGTDRFQLILPETKSVSDLRFGPMDNYNLDDNQIEIQVGVVALNFRDVLTVLKPTDDFKYFNVVGLDLSGVVQRLGVNVTKWKVGDRVCGLNLNQGALPSHVRLHEDHVLRVPENLSLAEAATLPAVFATAYHCLIEVAQLGQNDTVLIHTASGGVGLAAIDICKNIGANIICTAGSKAKRRYLKGLGIAQVFHSRNTSYSKEIMEVTGGRGVDVVLNSLTSEGFKEATLSCCSTGARFVEMSKMNIWTAEQVRELRSDVQYTIVDISVASGEMIQRLLGKLAVYLESNVTKPLPYIRFDAVNIRQALEYLQKAKHIGKIVCTIPQNLKDNAELKSKALLFNPSSTYLITGGLGGIGLCVCKWMIEQGAKNVILAGRSLPKLEIAKKIEEMNKSQSTSVIAVQLDVGNFEECQKLLQSDMVMMGLPPLKGIMHAAGTLADGLITNQTWPKLSSPFNAKVNGTMNLHELTKNLNLEFFVFFSSMASVFGAPAQCNHAAGNHFEDTFTFYRQSMGLPAITINWGPWSEVGVATDVDLPGFRPISNKEGLSALELALRTNRTRFIVMNVESPNLFIKFLPQTQTLIDEINLNQFIDNGVTSTSSKLMKSDQFWSLFRSKSSSEEREDFLKQHVKNTLKSVLKLDENDDVEDNVDFQELGVDSLMFVEIRNTLQALLGDKIVISMSKLRKGSTVNLLSKTLMEAVVNI